MATHPPVHLLTVDEALVITGRGLLLMPGLRELPSIPLRPGDQVQLELPSGERLASVIKGVDAVHNRKKDKPEINFFITLPKSLSKESAPPGTRLLWLGTAHDGNAQLTE
jgi:hypothetical protein